MCPSLSGSKLATPAQTKFNVRTMCYFPPFRVYWVFGRWTSNCGGFGFAGRCCPSPRRSFECVGGLNLCDSPTWQHFGSQTRLVQSLNSLLQPFLGLALGRFATPVSWVQDLGGLLNFMFGAASNYAGPICTNINLQTLRADSKSIGPKYQKPPTQCCQGIYRLEQRSTKKYRTYAVCPCWACLWFGTHHLSRFPVFGLGPRVSVPPVEIAIPTMLGPPSLGVQFVRPGPLGLLRPTQGRTTTRPMSLPANSACIEPNIETPDPVLPRNPPSRTALHTKKAETRCRAFVVCTSPCLVGACGLQISVLLGLLKF